MKKIFLLILTAVLLGAVLCGCDGNFKPVGEEKVTQMMQLLAVEDVDGAVAMLHPEAVSQIEDPEGSVTALCDLLEGRAVQSCEQESYRVNNQISTQRGSKNETGVFILTLSDGTQVKAEYAYLTNKAGEGFTSFYLHFQLPEQ